MTKDLQNMKIDNDKTRIDSCSSCHYVYQVDNIKNIENIGIYDNLDLEDEDDSTFYDSKSEENGHISAVFEAFKDIPEQPKIVKLEPTENHIEIDISAANKSDNKEPSKLGHNSAKNVKLSTPRSFKKITKPSMSKLAGDTPKKPLKLAKQASNNTPSVKRYFSSVDKDVDQKTS